MEATKFNIYYSISIDGPWTLDNPEPLDHVPTGNAYLLTSLRPGIQYYIAIVGGILNDDDEFMPLISQAIGPNASGAGGVQEVRLSPILIQGFIPGTTTTSGLGHMFEVI